METFGQKLKQAVESRGLTLEEAARTAGLDIGLLEALARDDYAVVPGEDAVTEGLQAIARLVNVEPDEVISDYLREREQCRQEPVADVIAAEVHDEPLTEDAAPRETAARSSGSLVLFVLAGAVVGLAVGAFIWLSSSGPGEVLPADQVSGSEAPIATVPVAGGEKQTAASGSSSSAATAEPSSPPGTVATAPAGGSAGTATAAVPDAQAPASVAAPGLAIPHHGVGTGVVNHQLVGEAGRFAEGTRVWFWTWVEGATTGDTINHVWLHDGREMLSVPLRLGGPRWRTQSYKNLHPGLTGQWTVEARDGAGNVLASRTFECFGAATD
jgi:cytoskeletal protein RodZ